jgi:hypothetical protein
MCPDQLWSPPSLLYNPEDRYSGRGVKLITHHLVLRLRMCRAVPQWMYFANINITQKTTEVLLEAVKKLV